ncbi:MAG: universal stress protein, partial [Treponemataceae bacterium]|nr:universal stress protein [Treponemataceae bacterium]
RIPMATHHHLNMKLVYACDTPTLKRLTMSHFLLEEENVDFAQNLRADGKKYLDYAMMLAKKKGVNAQAELLEGSVWGEVISAADKFKAELILVGGSGTRTFGHAAASGHFSLADKEIIMNAHCSVMVVRVPKIEQLFRIS